jgi:hypothetical protein
LQTVKKTGQGLLGCSGVVPCRSLVLQNMTIMQLRWTGRWTEAVLQLELIFAVNTCSQKGTLNQFVS